jgi:hypothetical protein
MLCRLPSTGGFLFSSEAKSDLAERENKVPQSGFLFGFQFWEVGLPKEVRLPDIGRLKKARGNDILLSYGRIQSSKY